MIIDIGNESYSILYERILTDDLDSEIVECLKSRYHHKDPEKITVIKGNGRLYVCSKVEDAVFDSIKKDRSRNSGRSKEAKETSKKANKKEKD